MKIHRRLILLCLTPLLLAGGGCEDRAAAPPAASGEGIAEVALKSGGTAVLQEIVTSVPGTEGATARFRFVLPGLRAGEDRGDDMQTLCDDFALSRIEGMIPSPQQIVISLADRDLPFGEPAPDAVQFFEAYRVQGGHCIWDMF